MTRSVQELLAMFDRLPDAAKLETAKTILNRAQYLGMDVPLDAELVLNAEQLFLELDSREAAGEHP